MSPSTIAEIEITGVDVPYDRPIQTAGERIDSAAWALIDLQTSDGVLGQAYVRCYSATVLRAVVEMARGLAPLIRGRGLAPADLWSDLRARFRLVGSEGVVGLALNLVDMAVWDALAKTVQLPLVTLLGAEAKPVGAYRSLRSIGLDELLEEASSTLADGFRALKVTVGGRSLDEDVCTLERLPST